MADKKRPSGRKDGKRPPMKLHLKEGALRKSLGMSTKKDMPESAKEIKPGDSPLMRKRKTFAKNAAKWNKGKRGK